MEHILIACGKQEKKTSEALSLTISPFLLNITPVRKLWIPHDVTSAILVSQTIKRRPYWCPKPVLWHINDLPPMWPWFRSRRRHHMWVEFVVRSHPKKPTLPNSNSIWNARTQFNEFWRTPKCYVGKQQITIKKKFFLRFLLYQYVLNMAVSHVSKNAP